MFAQFLTHFRQQYAGFLALFIVPGSYRATITATNTAGSSPPRRTTFKIVRAQRQR